MYYQRRRRRNWQRTLCLWISHFYGLTIKDVRKIVYDFAEKNRIPNSFNKDLGLAGRDFVAGLLRRNPRLSLRKPEQISINRIMGIIRDDVESISKN